MGIRRATFDDVVEQCQRLAQQSLRLRPGQPQIAAFDADGTLWGPDVADLLWDHLIEGRLLHRAASAPLARAVRQLGCEPTRDPYADFAALSSLHRAGRCGEETMVRVMLQGLAGLREEEAYLHAAEAIARAEEVAGVGDGGAGVMIEQLRALGYRVIVVSGSPHWAVEVAVRPLRIEPADIIAGRVAVVEGVLTEGILEPLPHGAGKIQAILRRFGSVPRVAVGNGVSDLPMLEATSHLRLLVNPTDALVRACEESRGVSWAMGLQDLLSSGADSHASGQREPAAAARGRLPAAPKAVLRQTAGGPQAGPPRRRNVRT